MQRKTKKLEYNDEFEDWHILSQDLENYLSAYDKDDFIDELKLEEKEKLVNTLTLVIVQ
ncbi:hypothetical protein HYD97_00920 [Mycoplasmopsis bovis]|nr:hypothetical protein [Mycoplasmopsis bovis]QQH34353.1 hypothetical protein HYD97_00920 [Mycoplasmopsis bovis]